MPVVVTGIVDNFHMRETEEADDEKAEQGDEAELCRTRTGRSGSERGSSSVHVQSFHPPPEGIEIKFRRRQVSWLADLAPSPPSRGFRLSGF
jgi:hypothetical protein